MFEIVTEKLTLAEECYAMAAGSELSKNELKGLKRILAKRNEDQIFAAICKLSRSPQSTCSDQAVGILYSLTEPQIAELEGTLKTIEGWD